MCFLQLFQTQAAQVQPKCVSLTPEPKCYAGGLKPIVWFLLFDTKLESPVLAKCNRPNVLLQVSNTMPIISADLFLPLLCFLRRVEREVGDAASGTTPTCSNQYKHFRSMLAGFSAVSLQSKSTKRQRTEGSSQLVWIVVFEIDKVINYLDHLL